MAIYRTIGLSDMFVLRRTHEHEHELAARGCDCRDDQPSSIKLNKQEANQVLGRREEQV